MGAIRLLAMVPVRMRVSVSPIETRLTDLDAGRCNHVVKSDDVWVAELAHQPNFPKDPFGVDHVVERTLHL